MEIRDLFSFYKSYCQKQGLKPHFHKTHLTLLASRLADLMSMCSHSKDKGTDRTSLSLINICELYSELEKHSKDYNDESYVYKTGQGEHYMEGLVDLFLHILIYIGGNDMEQDFLERLEKKVLQDKTINVGSNGRFQNNRIGWKR